MMRDNLKIFQSQKGQTLIEAVIAMAIALVLISSVLTLVNRSNSRATNARQSTQASKLAQEGLEIVRHIRDNDYDGSLTGFGAVCGGSTRWSDLYDCTVGDLSAGLDPCLITVSGIPTTTWCLVLNTAETITLDSATFTRNAQIVDNLSPICSDLSGVTSADTKRVIVTVTWQSPVGLQERNVISCLTNWQNR